MKKFFKNFLKPNSETSSMRISLLVGIILMILLCGMICFIIFKQYDMNYIDKIISAMWCIGPTFIGGKALQKFAEKQPTESEETLKEKGE